jgi:hypothetical protein
MINMLRACAGAAVLLCVLHEAPAAAQQVSPVAPAEAESTGTMVTLKRGTRVALIALREVSSADVRPGAPIEFRVHRPVTLGDRIVSPPGLPPGARCSASGWTMTMTQP